MNDSQKRALELMDNFITMEANKRRTKDNLAFLPTKASKPDWAKTTEQWAADWCAGWAFKPGHAMADALGVCLLTRAKEVGSWTVIENGRYKPEPDKDKEGNILFDKKGNVKPKPCKRYYMIWTQSTAFDFRPGYVIHSFTPEYANKSWADQLKHDPLVIQITDAKPASPAKKSKDKFKPRYPGTVSFMLYRSAQGFKAGKSCTMSQDDFVRFLITGPDNMPSNKTPMSQGQLI